MKKVGSLSHRDRLPFLSNRKLRKITLLNIYLDFYGGIG